MEDITDANRDTDVSSTTADVPEIQEISGSNGNVEMVITIEKIETPEEDENTTPPQSSAEGKETDATMVSVEPSVVEKSPISKESPHKINSTRKEAVTPRKESSSPIITVNSPITISPTKETDRIEVATPTKTTPRKETIKIVITSPKDEKNQSLKTTPTKVSDQIVDSSSKALSPCKELEKVIDLNETSVKETGNEAQTVQEPPIATSSEDIAISTDTTNTEELTDSSGTIAPNENQKETVSFKPPIDNCDKSNDSQLDANSDVSEKEHNKSISRELKSLIKSAKESKIISECTQLTSKTRKSRTPLELNTSVETEKITPRRNSNASMKSNHSEKSEKAVKRSMRSQNPEFVNKVKQFLNSVVGKNNDYDDDLKDEAKKELNEKSPSQKKRRFPEGPLIKSDKKLRTDPYCWRCHWAIELGTNEKTRPPMQCTVCPRVYHYKCLSSNERKNIDMERSWVCPECLAILYAESSDTRSISLKHVSVSHLGELLQHALTRMIELNGVEPFMQPVDRALFPDYDKCVVHPMDLSQMQRNIANGLYGSPEAFLSDAQWILHNSIIFNTLQSKLTLAARALVRLCRSEMGEIEACPECYAAAHNRRPTWFTDVCSKPHILLWAKLKGFPYWPAKGMSVNGSGVVDVRFFGAHDRAWVPAKDCFLYSEKDPNNVRSKKQIVDSMQEAEQYIRNISRKYGKFVYPPFKTPFEPTNINEQFKLMIPSFEGELRFQIKDKCGTASPKIKEKRRSNSKSSVVDGDASDNEVMQDSPPKVTESTEENNPDTVEVEIPMDLDEKKDKEKKVSRKRRRSEAEDYVIVTDSTKEKRRRIEKEATTPKQPEKQTDKTKKVIEDKAKGEENKSEKVEEKKKEKIKQKDENKEVPNSTTKEIVVSVNSPKTPKPIVKAKDKTDKPRRTIEKSAEKTEERKEKRLSRGKSLIINNVSADKDKTSRPKVKKVTKSTDVEILISKNMINKNLNKSLEKFKPSKERLRFDDDTTLAVLAREVSKTGMPTITSVRSLSEQQSQPSLIEVSVDANSNASVFTSAETAKDSDISAKSRESEPPVGRVGVRAFARMQTENAPSSDIEIKPEPMDFDTDRQMEKLEVMNSFRLQPVNPPATKLREVRINKLVVTPINRKKPEIRVKAKKTFPQAKKPEGSELNSKNSMVYIPIQPASGQAPVRPNRPVTNGVQVQVSASVATPTTTSPLTPTTSATVSQITPTSISMGVVSNMASMSQGPNVHTVPLITSVNGQWAFSLQPVMSVGGVDSSNGPSVNGIDRPGTLVAVPTPVSSMAQLNPQRKDDAQLPRLQHKPMLNPFDTNNSRPVPAPSTVGPLTAKLNQNASKLTDFFRNLMEETLEKVNEPAAHVTSLKLQLEQLQWKHRQELDELKHNHELAMVEMRTSLERDKNRAVNEERRTMHLNMEAAVKTAKSKQWCANCSQEAQFYCCWNTSYCDYPCQRAHWTTHAALCTQAQDSNGTDNSKDIHARLQPAPERLTQNKNPSKPTRVYTKEMPKTSLIVSMVEDSTGNQTVKCVGTYKPNAQAPPVIINKQLHSNEEAKKVTTSGGYLIVGGGSTVSTPRRPTIQYVHTS